MAFVTREWWHLPGKTQYADLMTFPNRCGQQMMLDVPICSCLEVCVRRFRETRFPQAFVNPSLI